MVHFFYRAYLISLISRISIQWGKTIKSCWLEYNLDVRARIWVTWLICLRIKLTRELLMRQRLLLQAAKMKAIFELELEEEWSKSQMCLQLNSKVTFLKLISITHRNLGTWERPIMTSWLPTRRGLLPSLFVWTKDTKGQNYNYIYYQEW